MSRLRVSWLELEVPATPTPGMFRNAGLDGGGFQNGIIADPATPGRWLLWGDVSGFHITEDDGASWDMSNAGMKTNQQQFGVASAAWDPGDPDIVYALIGTAANVAPFTPAGGLLKSADGARSWTQPATYNGAQNGAPTGIGNGNIPPALGGGARSIGGLIAVGGGRLYVGSAWGGVKRALASNLTSWTGIGPFKSDGTFVREVLLDPNDSDVLWVGYYDDASLGGTTRGLWKLTGLTGTPTATQKFDTTVVEDILILDTTIYIVCGTAGVFKSVDGGETWTACNTGIDTVTSKWYSLNGFIDELGKHWLIIGCRDGVAHGNGQYRTGFISQNGGATWACFTCDRSKWHDDQEYGTVPPRTWWYYATSQLSPGKSAGQIPMIALDPFDTTHNRVMMAARGGAWRSDNLRAASSDWFPAARYLALTVSNWVTVDRQRVGRVYEADGDWGFFGWTNNGETFIRNQPTFMTKVIPIAVADDGTVYVAGTAGGGRGAVAHHADPTLGTPWTDDGFTTFDTTIQQTGAVEVGRDAAGTRVVVLCGQQGVYRKLGPTWTKRQTSPAAGVFRWPQGQPFVYLMDKSTGLWRSIDYGLSYQLIWTTAGTWLAIDSSDPANHRAYCRVGTKIFRVDNVQDGTKTVDGGGLTAVDTNRNDATTFDVMLNGTIVVWSDPTVGTASKLWISHTHGSTWQEITDATTDAHHGQGTKVMALAENGWVFIVSDGSGMVRGLLPQAAAIVATTTGAAATAKKGARGGNATPTATATAATGTALAPNHAAVSAVTGAVATGKKVSRGTATVTATAQVVATEFQILPVPRRAVVFYGAEADMAEQVDDVITPSGHTFAVAPMPNTDFPPGKAWGGAVYDAASHTLLSCDADQGVDPLHPTGTQLSFSIFDLQDRSKVHVIVPTDADVDTVVGSTGLVGGAVCADVAMAEVSGAPWAMFIVDPYSPTANPWDMGTFGQYPSLFVARQLGGVWDYDPAHSWTGDDLAAMNTLAARAFPSRTDALAQSYHDTLRLSAAGVTPSSQVLLACQYDPNPVPDPTRAGGGVVAFNPSTGAVLAYYQPAFFGARGIGSMRPHALAVSPRVLNDGRELFVVVFELLAPNGTPLAYDVAQFFFYSTTQKKITPASKFLRANADPRIRWGGAGGFDDDGGWWTWPTDSSGRSREWAWFQAVDGLPTPCRDYYAWTGEPSAGILLPGQLP